MTQKYFSKVAFLSKKYTCSVLTWWIEHVELVIGRSPNLDKSSAAAVRVEKVAGGGGSIEGGGRSRGGSIKGRID